MSSFLPIQDKNLTRKELSALEVYTGGESLWINNYLRNRNIDQLNQKQKEKMKNYATHLNNIIRKAPTSTKKTKVYRGAEAMEQKWKNLESGDELLFTQKGLISTTFDINVALEFIEEDSDCCLLILNLPKGTSGLYISSSSAFSELDEDELLLPHGSKFIVTSRRKHRFGTRDIITYYADLIDQ